MIQANPGVSEVATLGGGCFWCIEVIFDELRGVSDVVSGYMGGAGANPTYREVCSGTTGHAEVIQVHYDPGVISFREILEVFFTVHDPTTLNSQGNDVGTQYRSGIYLTSPSQQAAAEASRDVFQAALSTARYGAITTEIVNPGPFYFAEDYHQQYLAKVPHGYCGLGGTGVTCQIGTGVKQEA